MYPDCACSMDTSQYGALPETPISSTSSPKQPNDQQATPPSSMRTNNRDEKPLSKLGMSATQATVSMFSGARDHPGPSGTKSPSEPFGPLNPNAADRVFPVRSVVSVDPTATPLPRTSTDGGFPGMSIGPESLTASRQPTHRTESLRSNSPERDFAHPNSTARASSRNRSEAGRDASVDSSSIRHGRTRSGTNPNYSGVDVQSLNAMMTSDDASLRSEGATSTDGGFSVSSKQDYTPGASNAGTGVLTARFKHVITEGGHAVVTGRGGETLQRCEDEPIHMPGAIQSFGLLIALKEEGGKLNVQLVSENSKAIIGYSPAQLFLLDSFLDILTDEQADNLLDHLDFIRDEEATDPAVNGPEVFLLSVRSPRRKTQKLWCAMHVLPSNRDLIICEFELEEDSINPLVPPGAGTPEPPEDTIGSHPTPEEFAESTVNMSRPLRVLRSARKKKGEAAAMEVFNIMSQVQEQLAGAPNLEVFLRVLIGVVKELTGFHRVMIYQFDQSWNGRVVAELVDPRATKDLYKGLNFPASDIPKQARDLYKVNKVRLLYDRDQETARLVCRSLEVLEKPLDMTYAYLRAMSPIHIKYLANMAVRASMSISINAFNELWGLIACHSYGSKGQRVSFPIRKMCRLVGDTACRNIERLSYASRLQARKLINTMPTAANPSGYIVASSEDLLKLFDADVGALSVRDETKILGKPQTHMQEILAMLEFLRLRKINSVLASQDVAQDFPDLRYQPGFSFIAGILYVPLSASGEDFIAFFRRGQVREVKWAGNPYEKYVKEGTEGYLEPRKSFKTWSETIVGKSRDWSEQEIETASVLCLVYGKFIEVWRQKEAALQNSQLTRILLANSAHEVRTPLNAIINYLEIALEGSLDHETRDNLARSHSASKSLIYVINDLLDLTKTEEGQDLVKEELFDLPTTLQEAAHVFQGDAKRKSIEYNVASFSHLPNKVVGDQRLIRQVLSNLIANAFQHTSSGSIKVDAWMAQKQPTADRFDIEIAVEDTGVGMSSTKVDALFRELEQVSFDTNEPLLDSDPFVSNAIDSRRTLGLGLAVVARTLRNMNGQLRLKSEEGKGSRFVVILGFDYPAHQSPTKSIGEKSDLQVTTDMPPTPPAVTEGEVTLINRSAQKRPGTPRRESTDSIRSGHSGMSQNSARSKTSLLSQKSDVDRLIDAIQEPFNLSETDLTKTPQQQTPQERRHGRPSSAGRELSPSSASRRSFGSVSAFHRQAGQEKVKDSKTPIKAVRVPEDDGAKAPLEARAGPKVLFELPNESSQGVEDYKDEPLKSENLSVLVAEDDPINSKIIKKRLEKMGHRVQLTVNGEECATAHGDTASHYDVVLMDLQMPIVDGFSSTKMIRSFEKTDPGKCLSKRARINGRIPIFAVSASLVERELQRYKDTGFDGWFLKPIDFSRVGVILKGLVENDARNASLYQPGHWEQGGWFDKRQEGGDMFSTDTRPSGEAPTMTPAIESMPRQAD